MRKFLRLAMLCLATLCQMCLIFLIAPTLLGQPGQPEHPDDSASTAHWRFAHFAAGAGNLDVYVDGQAASRLGVGFGEVSGWKDIAPGSYTVTVNSAGTSDAVFTLTLVLTVGQWITVAAVDDNQKPVGMLILEDFSPIADSETRLTVISTLDQNASVDVVANGTPILEGIKSSVPETNGAEGHTGSGTTVELDANTYDIQVTTTGAREDILIDAGAVDLQPRRSYLAAALSTDEDPRLVLVGTAIGNGAVDNPGGSALIRVAHLSSGTPPITVQVNGEAAGFDGLRFPEFSQWVRLDAGEVSVTVEVEDSAAAIAPLNLRLEPSTATTLAIIGTLANNTLEARALREDYAPLAPGFVRVSVLNAHAGLGPISIQSADGTSYIEELGYPGFFGENNGFNQFIVEEGTYDLRVTQTETDTAVIDLTGTNLFAGRNYFIAVIVADPPFVLTFSDLAETQALLAQ
jgi:Ni,Fe-hydrogenase III small subunit